MLPGLDLYCADPTQPLTTGGEKLDDLDHDLEKVTKKMTNRQHRPKHHLDGTGNTNQSLLYLPGQI